PHHATDESLHHVSTSSSSPSSSSVAREILSGRRFRLRGRGPGGGRTGIAWRLLGRDVVPPGERPERRRPLEKTGEGERSMDAQEKEALDALQKYDAR